jgi:hypothetical protein
MKPAGRLSDEELRAIYDEGYVEEYDRTRCSGCSGCSSSPAATWWPISAAANGVLLELIAPRVREYVGVDFSEPFVFPAAGHRRVLCGPSEPVRRRLRDRPRDHELPSAHPSKLIWLHILAMISTI